MKKSWKLFAVVLALVCLSACVGVNPWQKRNWMAWWGTPCPTCFFDRTVNNAESVGE